MTHLRLTNDRSESTSGAHAHTQSQLPVVDISPLNGKNARAKRKVVERIRTACAEAGFLYIEGHGVDARLTRSVYEQAKRWFERPLKEKLKYYIGHSDNHRGYVPQSEQGVYEDEGARYYEAFDISLDLPADDPDVLRGHYLLGPNVWPREQPAFREALYGYYREVAKLGNTLCGAFECSLGVKPGSLRRAMTKPTSQLRLLHYLKNACEHTAAQVNMGAHTDYECFTILHQTAPGLQVLNASNEWIDAPPLDGTYVINIGDLLETWSNGRFRSTLHRVLNHGDERFSLPFFVAANYDAVIEPLDCAAPTFQSRRYRPVVAGHHLLGQLLRDFPYLKEKHCRGELKLPFKVPSCNPFEAPKLAAAA